jgi:hypothetical protein
MLLFSIADSGAKKVGALRRHIGPAAMAPSGRQRMQTKRVRNWNGRYSWRDRARDPALTTMLAVQCLIIFSEPFAAMGFETVRDAVQLLFFALTFLVYLISGGPHRHNPRDLSVYFRFYGLCA